MTNNCLICGALIPDLIHTDGNTEDLKFCQSLMSASLKFYATELECLYSAEAAGKREKKSSPAKKKKSSPAKKKK